MPEIPRHIPRALIVGDAERAEALSEALGDESLELVRAPEEAAGEDEIAGIAAALRRYEALLADDAPDAVLLLSSSNEALAALLVATKLGIPVASVDEGAATGDPAELNRRLIDQLRDASLAGDAAKIAAWLRSAYTLPA